MAVKTLIDSAREKDPSGNMPVIAEQLTKDNEILLDLMFKEANGQTGHQSTIRTGLPIPTWRRFYKGTPSTKSKTAQVNDSMGILDAYARVDKDEADLNKDVKAYRASEDLAHLEGMNQSMATTFFYGDSSVAPEQFNGLAPRFSDLSGKNAANIVDGGGSGAKCTSLWLVCHGEQTVFGIYPQGSKAGLDMTDDGVKDVNDEDGNPFTVYQSHYKWKAGLVVKDWRFVVRIANIDTSTLADYSSASDIIQKMVVAMHKIPNLRVGKPAFYMNRDAFTLLDLQTMNKSNIHFTYGADQFGGPVLEFRKIPCRLCDAILNTEAAVE